MPSIPIVSIRMVKDSSIPYGDNKISSPKEVKDLILQYLGYADREHMIAICLDVKRKVNAIHTISIGSLNSSIVHPREVFKIALLANASTIILAHNHPSGDPTPSREDVEITKKLCEAGIILGVEVEDHVIVGSDTQYVSMREKGLI